MARYSGINGTVHSVATGGVVAELTAEVQKWTLEITSVIHKEGSNASGPWKGATAGAKEWSGTITLFSDDTQNLEFVEGSKYDIELHRNGDDADYFSGTMVVESISTENDMDDGATVMNEVTFQGDGALTKTGVV